VRYNDEGYAEKRTRVVKETEERAKRQRGKARIHGPLCEKNQVPRAYAFSEGGSSVTRRGPPGFPSERGQAGRGEERKEKE